MKPNAQADNEQNQASQPSLLSRIKSCLVSAPQKPQTADLPAEQVLRQSDLFEHETNEVLTALSQLVRADNYPAGSYLCRQGTAGDRLYFIVDGQINIKMSLGNTDGPVKIASVGAGAVLGLIDLADHQGCSADCIAAADVLTFSLNRETWEKLFKQDDAVGSAMRLAVIREFCKNIAATNDYVGSHP